MEKLWLKHYPPGVPNEIDASQYNSLLHLFHESCEQHKDRIAYVNQGTTMTYGQLQLQCDAFAAYLQQLNLSPKARVAIMLPNCLQYPIALFGILRAGFIVVNTNPLYTPDEIAHQLSDAKAEAIIVLSNMAHSLEKAMSKLPDLKHIIVTEYADCFHFFKRLIVNFVVHHIKRLVPAYNFVKKEKFLTIMHTGRKSTLKPVHLTHQDIAFIQYTGGTTGVAKGAVLTHGNMVANVLQASAWISPLSIGVDDIIVTALPLYHIFSLTANCLTFLKAGAKNILITNPRDMTGFIKDIQHSQFTALTGVNTLFNSMLNHPLFDKIDFSKLKLTLSGGMALHENVAKHWLERSHTPILEAYGLTETSPAVAINPVNLKTFNGSIGFPVSSTEISIRDDDGQEVPLGERGELSVNGPQVMQQYWQNPKETALVFWPDGFLRTGDIVKADEQGFIYLVDRKKEMILISGFNVYPNEVENVISLLPGVLEVGVIGIKSAENEEQIKACIVKRDPNLTEKQVKDHCREHLTAYKVPKIIEFYDTLPKSNIGKILRRALK